MVKNYKKIFILTLIISLFCFINSCNIDLLGLIVSSDIEERFAEKDNMAFFNSRGWNTLTFDNEDNYSFIVLADTHIEDGQTWGFEDLEDVISAHNSTAGNTKIEFMVVLGDITQYGSEQDIDKFIEIADSFSVPCYPVIGNHDIYFFNWPVWRDKIGSTVYRIDSAKTSLYMLDSANSFFGREQLNWLERDIKNTKERVFVFTHSPLFVNGPADMQQITDIRERARIVSILQGKCDTMFMGHSHKYYYNIVGGVEYIAVEDFVGKKAYCIVTVKPTGITYDFKNL
ncbi:MAG: metallophosphoesterase [Treponema sp.]|nr:metallophosphoesterase [Treponema sp.]